MTLTQEIRTELDRGGILSAARFYVNITSPPIFNKPGFDSRAILLMCRNRGATASLPGIQLNTSSIRRYGTGLEERKPVSTIVVDQQFTFICDRDAIIHDFFSLWLNTIVTGNKFQATDTTSINGVDPYRYPGSVLYKKDYATTIDIILIDQTADEAVVHIITLFNAFPVAVGDIQLNWSSQNEFAQVPVTFTYTHWRSQSLNLAPSPTGNPPAASLKDLVSKIGSTALLLSTLKKPRNIQDILSVVNNAKTIIGGFNFKFGT